MQRMSRLHISGQHGFTLLEVLIAIVVLSVGLLGVAGLQAAALRYNQSAAERSAAVMQLHSMEDALRASKADAVAGNFNLGLEASAPVGNTMTATVLRNWRNEITNALGGGATGAVQCTGEKCSVTVRWNDSRANQGSEEQLLLTEVYL